MNENERETYHRRHRPGLFFPVLIITLGVLLLLQNVGILTESIWDLLWKCWPVFLIWIGLDSLYNRQGVAGPVFFIGIGAIFLLNNFGLLAWNTWDLIFQLWPVMLIAWGLDLVVGRRAWWGALAALALLAVVVVAVLAVGGLVVPAEKTSLDWQPEGEIEQFDVTLKPAVGSVAVDVTSDTAYLVAGELYHRKGLAIEKVMTEKNGQATLTLALPGETVMNPLNQANLPDWQLTFDERAPLDLTVRVGAGSADLDLRTAALTALDVEVGVGSAEIWLPAETFTARVDGGVGETVIYIPVDVAVRLEADPGVTAFSRPPGFDEESEDVYEYRTSQNDLPKITLIVEQGVGRLVIAFAP
jgi:hypothetical protein